MKYLIAFAVLVVLAVGGYALFHPAPKMAAPSGNSYKSETYGIAFFYPDGFTLSETDDDSAERSRHTITITRTSTTTLPEAGEGPSSVSVTIYDNEQDKLALMDWVTGSSFSNYKLGPGTIASTTVGGVESLTYRWSGLYEGETTAFVHGDSIIAVAGSFMDPRDPVIGAYRMVLSTMALK